MYGRHGSVPLELDAYLPPGATAAPAVVFVHGGGWVQGRRSEYATIGAAFARAGLAGFSVDYTLCDATHPGWPLEVREILQAVGFIRAHAASLHVDPHHIGVMGDSAGATLALDAAMEVGRGQRTGLQAAAGWSGAYDLVTFRTSPAVFGGTGVRLNSDLAWFTGCLALDTRPCARTQADASPARHVRPDAPPTLLATSDRYDPRCEIVDPGQTLAMAAALRAERVAVQVDVLHECAHGIGYRPAELSRTIAFFTAALGRHGTQATGAARTSSAGTSTGVAGAAGRRS